MAYPIIRRVTQSLFFRVVSSVVQKHLIEKLRVSGLTLLLDVDRFLRVHGYSCLLPFSLIPVELGVHNILTWLRLIELKLMHCLITGTRIDVFILITLGSLVISPHHHN